MITVFTKNVQARALFLLLISVMGLCTTTQASILLGKSDSSSFEQGETAKLGYPLGFGVHFGTTGFGLHFYAPLGSHFGVRAATSYMPFYTGISGTYDDRRTHSTIEAKLFDASLIFGWTPFAHKPGFFRSFGLNAGGAYFFKIDGKVHTRLSDDYKYGDILVDPSNVGTIESNIQWKKTVSPYAGIGWNNIVIDSRFSMHIDLGCYYLSEPSTTMTATGLLEESVSNAATIERNIKNYRYLPRAEFGFTYRLK